MSRRLPFLALAVFMAFSSCFNFDQAYEQYCDAGHCGAGGGRSMTGGGASTGGGMATTGGGTASGGGSGATGGGSGTGGGNATGGSGTGGGSGLPNCDAGQLCYVQHFDTPKVDLFTVVAASPQNIFAGGAGGKVVRWNGTAFAAAQLPQTSGTIRDMAASSPTEVFAVGDPTNVIHRFDGTSWIPYTQLPGRGFNAGVYATGPGQAVAYSNYSETLLWNGTAWTQGPLGDSSPNPEDVHGCTATEFWVPVSEGDIYYYNADGGSDGGILKTYTAGGASSFYTVWCDPRTGVWVAGAGGVVLHDARDGTGFQQFDAGLTASVLSVWVSEQGDLWLAGRQRTLVRFTNRGSGERTAFNVRPFEIDTYTAIKGTGDELWLTGLYSDAAGDGGALLRYTAGR
jgi:hypothetical protein